jgi:hypothetical protein
VFFVKFELFINRDILLQNVIEPPGLVFLVLKLPILFWKIELRILDYYGIFRYIVTGLIILVISKKIAAGCKLA